MLDLIIKGGTVVDGTGNVRRRADVGVQGGRIAAIGRIDGSAKRTIDAAGKIVCPGFVDIHTHYDAQVFWDPLLSPSCYHGTTSIIGGNCGFSIAPLTPSAGEYLMPMLARVEGMPLESLRAGVPWDWHTFGEYLDRIDGTLAINAGFMVGHSAMRRVVMGERAVGHHATPDEIAQMVGWLRRSLAEGGMGFSTTISPSHNDADGNPVPSRHAHRDEFIALARAVREFPGTALELLPGIDPFDDEKKQFMTDLSLAAGRPLNWNVLPVGAGNESYVRNQLSATDFARARGADVIALTIPQITTNRINLRSGFIFDDINGWDELFRFPLPERKRRLADPDYRARLLAFAEAEDRPNRKALVRWDKMLVMETFRPELAHFTGRRVGEIAQEQGKTPFDAMIDLALADDLNTSFQPPMPGIGEVSAADWQARARVWLDDRAMVGASDCGAHLDMIDTFALPPRFLAKAVRETGLMSLEIAVRQLTDRPARLYGLRERGRLQAGWHADIVVFDLDTIGCTPTYTRKDLPAGAPRLYADAIGIEHVLVNGVEIVQGREATGARPGTVLRSGRDTETVEVPGHLD